MPQNNVTYTYGTPSNIGTNACGRLLRVDDGTGYQTFAYDRLGNVAENTRTIALPFEDSVYNFRMLFEYDSWNRIQRIVYPDSEVVSYSYNTDGELYSVSSLKGNIPSSLINSILYDEFGHRTQVNFGNGVTTNYTYDILQRLSGLNTYNNNANLQKILYSFDYEDNITEVKNTASGANGLGGDYINVYYYDGLYRLTSANGGYIGNNSNYSLEMAYTPAGRLCNKFQNYTATGNVYAYSPNSKQHAVRRYYNGLTHELSNLRWDDNGNLAQQTLYSVNNNVPTYQTMRMLFWDEDDRLNLVAGDGYLSYYAYGHDGNRAIKMTGTATIDPNGTLINTSDLNNITIYPNEYLTVTQAEYTKYYYAGGNRIASKIGTGGFGKMTRLCTLDQGPTYNANTLLNFVLYQVTNTTQPPTDEYPVDVCAGYSVATELLTNPLPDFYISQTNLNFTQNNLLQQFRQNLAGGAEAVYYFHSDHLGSASWITDGTGGAVQHLLYLPFGEHFANEYSSGYDERFTFTGKERDAETGYYYHGARFNSSDIGWLSVDPMSDKYPSISPYAYCAWNPIKLVDPEGEDIKDPPANLKYTIQKGDNFWNLETEWNLPHGTLQEINPSIEPHNLQIGQTINVAKMDEGFIIVGNDVIIPNGREMETPNEEGSIGIIQMASSEDFLQLRMAFETLLYEMGADFCTSTQKIVSSLKKICSRNTTWQYGRNHSMIKWNNEFKKRGWSETQVSETIRRGEAIPANNKINPNNKATRYKNKTTEKSVVIDKQTRELIHVGSKDFKYD